LVGSSASHQLAARTADKRTRPAMAARELKAVKCPNEVYALRNLATVSPEDYAGQTSIYVCVKNVSGKEFFFSAAIVEGMKSGEIGFSSPQRSYAKIAMGDKLQVSIKKFQATDFLGAMTLQIDFMKKKQAGKDRYDTTALSKTIVSNFNRQVFEQDMEFVFAFQGETSEVKFKGTIMKMTSLGAAGTADDGKDILVGVLSEQTKLTFTVPGTSNVTLAGSGGGASSQKSLFDQGWKFDDMGIGGLGGQFQEMFRRAFVSRIFPPEVVEKLGIVHCKGIMLYGPPGTGKTLMARQIGKMLNGMDPKVVNGPEIMSKYVGESEENVRKLFIDAEQEQLERGENSQLHVIIFDEIDAICKERGSTGGGTGVADSVVNQLLSKIDGVEALTNVLLIGMTNRLDMIDEALLRPGRFELKLQIGLPDEEGRVEIFKIHTKKLVDNKYLDDLSIIPQLAARAKNFSGAEIAGLIRAAVSYATNRCMKDDSPTEIDQRKLAQLKVSDDDFNLAFADVIPAFGSQQDEFVKSGDDIVEWDLNVDVILKTGKLLVQQAAQSTRTPLVSCLLAGPPGAGKTSLAARIAQNSEFPFIKLITPDKLVGLGTAHKISRIKKVFEDAYKSVNSVVVVDDIERLIEFVEIGNRFSNDILQALLVLIKKAPPPGHHMLIVATTSNYEVMRNMGLAAQFSKVQHVNYVEQAEQVLKVVQECAKFDADTTQKIAAGMDGRTVAYSAYDAVPICIGIKKVYGISEMAKQADDIADTFLNALYFECKENRTANY